MSLRATLQALILAIGVLFEIVREAQGAGCYAVICFEQIYLRSFIYYFSEHLIFIVMCLNMWLGRPTIEDFKTDRFFVIVAVVDFFDYLLTGNNVWYRIQLTQSETSFFYILPLSMNVIGFFGFLIYANWQWRTNGSRY